MRVYYINSANYLIGMQMYDDVFFWTMLHVVFISTSNLPAVQMYDFSKFAVRPRVLQEGSSARLEFLSLPVSTWPPPEAFCRLPTWSKQMAALQSWVCRLQVAPRWEFFLLLFSDSKLTLLSGCDFTMPLNQSSLWKDDWLNWLNYFIQ